MSNVYTKVVRAFAALSADEQTTSFDLGFHDGNFDDIAVYVRAGASAAGTLDCTIQLSHDNVNWFNDTTYTQITTSASSQVKKPSALAKHVRLDLNVGASWSASVEVAISFKSSGYSA